MTQGIGPITVVSFFNDFIDFICFESLDPTVSNSYEQDKYYHLHIEWWIPNLAGVVWLRSTCMHKNQEGFLKWEKLKFNPPWISLKTDLNHNGPNPSWNHYCSSLGKWAQAAGKVHVRQESHTQVCTGLARRGLLQERSPWDFIWGYADIHICIFCIHCSSS